MLYWGGKMDFLLNEKSLDGQFDDEQQFLKSLKPVIKSIELIQKCPDLKIYKTENFFKCNITKDKILCDLRLNGVSDELLSFKLSLDKVLYRKPYWDRDPVHDISQSFIWNEEDVSGTSLAEAAVTDSALLSFDLDKFKDRMLQIKNKEKEYEVHSIHTPKYLIEQYNDIVSVDTKTMLVISYEGTRIDCSTMEDKYGVSILQKDELDEFISTLNKFVKHDSWESIGRDDGLEYKKYSPSSEKDNWFSGSKYKGKTIMKFRFSSVLRCYGYRKGDRFRVLRLERDHKISDKG